MKRHGCENVTLEKDDDKEYKDCRKKICKIGKVGAIESLFQRSDLVLTCDQKME